jgi:AraC-like DNA-binding protein
MERFQIVNTFLSRRLARARPVSSGVDWAWRRLEETTGAVAVGSLARQLGWSRKRFSARFRDEVGLTPKTAARVVRFGRLVEHVRALESPDWGRLAEEFGYFDQAHLIRDFLDFAGITPTAFTANRSADGLSILAR